MASPQPPPPAGTPAARHGTGVAGAIALYALARLALVAVVAVPLLLAGVPLAVAVLVALVVAMPLSMVLFRGLRDRLDTALAELRLRRSAERDALRARLRGEVTGSGEPPQHEAGRGQG